MKKENTPILSIKAPRIKADENSKAQDSSTSNSQGEESNRNDPFNQLEGFRLFSYFTANIIKEDVIFTR